MRMRKLMSVGLLCVAKHKQVFFNGEKPNETV